MISLRYLFHPTFGGGIEWTTGCLDTAQVSLKHLCSWYSCCRAFNAEAIKASLGSFLPPSLSQYWLLFPCFMLPSQGRDFPRLLREDHNQGTPSGQIGPSSKLTPCSRFYQVSCPRAYLLGSHTPRTWSSRGATLGSSLPPSPQIAYLYYLNIIL